MKNILAIFAFCFLLACSSLTRAQDEPRNVSQVLDAWVTKTEQQLVPAAEAMPEDKYSFAPTGGEFKGVRTFAEQVKHLAAANYQLGAAIVHEEPPAGTHDESAPDTVRTKAQVMEYLRGSFASLHHAAHAIDEQCVNEPELKGHTRLWLMIDALEHSSNHYGQMVEYLRMNGIVPPESR
jgi:hypothetical protein